MKYEVIIVGGGHAGSEAALACSRKGHKTLLVSSNLNNIVDMACNPSVGGPAKGTIVREIDALGGEMGKNIDKSFLQMKFLNTKKGPAVKALRAQADKITYPKEMIKTLRKEKNLVLKEGMVEDLIVKDNSVLGVILETGENVFGEKVILTTGTYLRSHILRGDVIIDSGPHGEKYSKNLSNVLKNLGFIIKRLKTGTPPRIEKKTIDYSKAIIQEGDKESHYFSFTNEGKSYDVNKQEPCFLIYTTEETKKIIIDNLKKSSMYGGFVEGVGPRYCPSIEDKIVRFKDKERHQLFLEPESIYYDDIYLQGFSTSMPINIQEKMIRSLPGLENCKINKYAYAIEYDAIDSLQVKNTLETKVIKNLYTAGQINGTSGYEEAAGQGLIAGINASLSLEKKEPLILKRNEAYLGVLIDDLVTKGVLDPYRMLTSRAEYRLLLRHDNADLRLTDYGYKIGLISEERYKKFNIKRDNIKNLMEELKRKTINPYQEKKGDLNIKISLYDLLKNPSYNINDFKDYLSKDYKEEELEEGEINIKYEGYIKKEKREIEKMKYYENFLIPEDIDYKKITNIASEALQKLEEIRPYNIAQAMRISGVNYPDIMNIELYLKRRKNDKR